MTPRPIDPQPEPFEDSLELAREGRHAEALQGLLGSLAGRSGPSPHRVAAANALGRVARMAEAAGDTRTAQHALDEALRIAPRFVDLHYRRARVLMAAGRPADARAALEAALAINPRYLAARVELALFDAREGRLAAALETLRGLAGEPSIDDPLLLRQGLESLEHADWDEAGEQIRRAFHIGDAAREEIVEPFHRLIASGERERARRWIRDAVLEHETWPDLHCLMGTVELEDGHIDDALCSLARALELHPRYHAARIQFARALEALGDVTQASEQIGFVLDEDPTNPQALQLHERWSRRGSRRRRFPGEASKVA